MREHRRKLGAILIVVLGFVLYEAVWAEDWPPSQNPTVRQDKKCVEKTGNCYNHPVNCQIRDGSIDNSFFSCNADGKSAPWGDGRKVTKVRAWGKCESASGKTCTEYAKFYCIEVTIYTNQQCTNVDCNWFYWLENTCDPAAPQEDQ